MKKEYFDVAKKAMENSYSPYSKFKVGACLVCDDGKIYKGTNVESAAFSATNCAERSALFSAISDGERKFKEIYIVSSSNEYTFPCGVCRQALSEFNPEMKVYLKNDKTNEIGKF